MGADATLLPPAYVQFPAAGIPEYARSYRRRNYLLEDDKRLRTVLYFAGGRRGETLLTGELFNNCDRIDYTDIIKNCVTAIIFMHFPQMAKTKLLYPNLNLLFLLTSNSRFSDLVFDKLDHHLLMSLGK